MREDSFSKHFELSDDSLQLK